MTPRLVIFDLDGTLIDSGASILRSMRATFRAAGHVVPDDAAILSVIGLSLEVAIGRLVPEGQRSEVPDLAAAYRDTVTGIRAAGGDRDPLFAGGLAAIDTLARRDDVLLGIATGKAMRGIRHFLDTHGLADRFVTLQAADTAPSKPHPGMVLHAMAETGVAPADTVVVGDTTYDMEMARSAGAGAFGVAWGHHDTGALLASGASVIIETFNELVPALERAWAARVADRV